MADKQKSSSVSANELIALMQKAGHNNDTDFESSITDSCQRIYDSGKKSTAMKDAYGNSLLAIGNDDKVSEFSNYSFTNDTLNWPLWLALYNESWVFKRAIDKPAQDEIRAGITIQGNNSHKNEIQRRLKLYRDDLIQLRTWSNLFGGSLAFMMFDNFKDEDYAQPFNKKKVREAKTLKFYVVDRWYGVSPDYNHIVTKMSSVDYGKPKYYNVTMADGKTYKYHHSYVIRSEGRIAPKLVKNGMLQGWGYSEGSHILNELARDEKLKNSIQSLVNKALIEVIKMSGMRGVFMGADEENAEQLKKRLEMVNWGRTYNSLTFLDKEDEYQEHGFAGLSGLSDLLQQNMWQIAAALEMQGVLFGDMKQGFSTDSDALERYDEVILGRNESYTRQIYEKLLNVIYVMMGITDKVEFEFNSLLAKKQDKERIEGIKDFVALCSQLSQDGVLTPMLYAKALQTYISKGLIDFGLTDDEIKKIEKRENEVAEDFDLNNDNNNNDEPDGVKLI